MKKIICDIILFPFFDIFAPFLIHAQSKPPVPPEKPEKTVKFDKTVGSSMPLQIIVMLTLLSFIPAILISMTCFTRLIVVFHFLRQATRHTGDAEQSDLIGLSLFMTFFVMSPTLTQDDEEAISRCRRQITQTEALKKDSFRCAPICSNTRGKRISPFLSGCPKAPVRQPPNDVHAALIPAHMISELKTAFQIGFVLFHSVSRDRYGGFVGIALDGNDAAPAGHRVDAAEDLAVRDG